MGSTFLPKVKQKVQTQSENRGKCGKLLITHKHCQGSEMLLLTQPVLELPRSRGGRKHLGLSSWLSKASLIGIWS